MYSSLFYKPLIIFTVLSIALGLASAEWPAVANMGWALGTLISIFGGVVYGMKAVTKWQAALGGALIGGISIAIGCFLAYAIRALPFEGASAATVVGLFSGCIAGFLTRTFQVKTQGVAL